MAIRKKKKKKSKVDEVAADIVEIVSGNKKDKAKKTKKSKAKSKSVKKDKSKSKKAAFTAKDVKTAWKQLEFPSIITTKEVTIMVEEMTGYKLGTDITAGAKNLRRYLRTLDRYSDGEITYYRWSIKEDLQELADIMEYYNNKKAIAK